ncbi:hypothetical protein [Melittangium boletus]
MRLRSTTLGRKSPREGREGVREDDRGSVAPSIRGAAIVLSAVG